MPPATDLRARVAPGRGTPHSAVGASSDSADGSCGSKWHRSQFCFAANACSPRATPESLEVRWFEPAAIPWNELAFPSTRAALREHLARRGLASAIPAGPGDPGDPGEEGEP